MQVHGAAGLVRGSTIERLFREARALRLREGTNELLKLELAQSILEGEPLMGRIVDLCGEIAAAADEGPEGSCSPPTRGTGCAADWSDEDIEDALAFVKDSLLQSELVEAADSLSARLVELLGTWGDAKGWAEAVAGRAMLSVDVIRQVAHRLDRLEEILEVYRDEKPPDRRGFDELQRRLMDQGIENEMRHDPAARGREPSRDEPFGDDEEE